MQGKPYPERIKILKRGVTISVIILLVIWFATLRFRNKTGGLPDAFAPLMENFKKLKDLRAP